MRAVLYGASVGLSFFLMLVFMTYNVRMTAGFSNIDSYTFVQAYLILAVVLGAIIGHYMLGEVMEPDSIGGRGLACH